MKSSQTGTSRLLLAVLVSVFCLLVSGCAPSGGEPSQEPSAEAATSVDTPSPTLDTPSTLPPPDTSTGVSPTSTPSEATTSPNAPDTDVVETEYVDRLLEWKEVYGPADRRGPNRFNDKWTITTGQRSHVYIDGPRNGELSAADDYTIWGMAITGDQLLVVFAEETSGDYRIELHDLTDGTTTLLEEWGGTPAQHVVPRVSVGSQWVVWDTMPSDGTHCIRAVPIATAHTDQPVDVVCVDDPEVNLAMPTVSDGTVTYRMATRDPDLCLTLYSGLLPDNGGSNFAPTTLPHEECLGFYGISNRDLSVWVELDIERGNPRSAPLYATTTATDDLYVLGRTSALGVALCDGKVVWHKELVDNVELRSWVPGARTVSVVYRSEPDWYPTTSPSCDADWVVVSNSFTGEGVFGTRVLAAPVDDL